MRVVCNTIARCILSLVAGTYGVDLSATTFGQTTLGTGGYITPCTTTTSFAVPITVDVSSRILVSFQSTINATANYQLDYHAVLRNSTDTADVARSSGGVGTSLTSYLQVGDNEVLSDLALNGPYTATAGNYLLKMTYQTSGSCTGNGVYLLGPTLTYVLLSSVLDRIFANGFSMVTLEDRVTMLA